jgi:flagellar basal-body rod protein FlgB
MWLDRLLFSRTTRAVELAASFTEQRHRVLAENVANIDTPDYQTKRVDVAGFQRSLREALDDSKARDRDRVELGRHGPFTTDAQGSLHVKPTLEPAQNVLFHDGTNVKIEHLMAEVTRNTLSHQLATKLLGSRYGSLMSAIKGTPK